VASHSSSYCLFHDQDYWKYDPDVIKERLAQKVEDAKQSNEALFCIGYNLFEIRLSGRFKAPVYFDFAKFHRCPFFNGTTFDVASFEGARFEGPAVFQEVTFRKADFKQATFIDEANFRKAVFREHDFTRCKFLSSTTFIGEI
jgi:uncharacterized protein YjbI with pentapeptide repeats